ncbi:hypothetical protein NP233_g11300 [Leucocoprinus birnbaumii]|uniref:G-patch domain-containing protein n=1 Tax=Leucocoprinus birnbaumii TaxID=56174 RepID=A0AAD5VGT1_9AGAR|nr:hypothetical protein NP233_g11300 [Leucocoprinus birnbaumii]
MAKKGKKSNTTNSRGRGPGNGPFIPGRGRGHVFGHVGLSQGSGGYNPHTNAPGSSFTPDELDFTIHMYADAAKPPQALGQQGNSNGYSTPRGGRGGGRGWRGRGRGRGGFYTPPPNGNRQSGNNRGGYSSPHPRGTATPRGGSGSGRGRGAPLQNEPDFSPRHGRGLGATPDTTPNAIKKPSASSTLSDLLYASRPFLRPIKFVPSVHTPFLFQYDQDEIMKPTTEEIGDDDAAHVPTADRIERIFHGDIGGDDSSSSSSSEDDVNDEDEKEIEEIDFNDLARLAGSPTQNKSESATITASTTKSTRKIKLDGVLQTVQDQVNTSFYQNSRPDTPNARPAIQLSTTATEQVAMKVEAPSPTTQQQSDSLFFVDTQPSFVPPTTAPSQPPAPVLDDDEEIIVYVAPHPKVHSRSNSANQPASAIEKAGSTMDVDTSGFEPYNPPATLSLASMSIQDPPAAEGIQPSTEASRPIVSPPEALSMSPALPASAPIELPTVPTIASLKKFDFASTLLASTLTSPLSGGAWERKKAKRERTKANKRAGGGGKRGRRSGGGMAAYGALIDDLRLYGDEDVLEDERWQERRRGDSDLDWGTEDEGDVLKQDDQDVFAPIQQLSEKAKGKQKAREDLDHGMEIDSELDVEAMKQFVSGLMGKNAGTFMTMDDVEDEKKLRREDEEGLGGAVGSSDEEDGDAEGDEIDAVLELEEKLLIGESSDDEESDDDDDDDELDVSPKSGFQARLEKLRAKARARKPRDEDDEDDDDDMLEENMAWAEDDDDYDDDMLINQVQDILDANVDILEGRDRKQKNKLFKAIRNGEFDLDYADIQPARKSKDKYKDLPPELLDQWELDRQRKAERKHARELEKLIAATEPFTRKKRRKGKGDARYTTLSKTSRSGIGRIDEWKVQKVLRRAGGRSARGDSFGEFEDRKKGRTVPKHREGDEVGGTAPKIGEGNIGFKMLAAMGWSEGNRIGLSGGLDAPLIAIIKHSKLGLGATK